jgi:hypothetical protein
VCCNLFKWCSLASAWSGMLHKSPMLAFNLNSLLVLLLVCVGDLLFLVLVFLLSQCYIFLVCFAIFSQMMDHLIPLQMIAKSL